MPGSATLRPVRATARARRAEMTGAPARLWGALREWRRQGIAHFRRQVPIGFAIVDFADHGHRLVVEVVEPGVARADTSARDAWLLGQGYRIVQVRADHVVGQMDRVLDEIRAALRASHPHP